jgi:Protein of unknown function (DUF1375)
MVSHFGDCGSIPPPGVFKGTVFDAGCLAAPFLNDPPLWWAVPFGVVDLPFSFAVDTIIFPCDLADYIDRKKRESKVPLQPNPQGGANGRQPFGSETNRTSTAAAPSRSF